MNETTNEKILKQVMDIVKANSPLAKYDVMTISLQLLGWARMSKLGAPPGVYERSYVDPGWLKKAWDDLAEQSDILRAAYSHWKAPSRLESSRLRAAVDFCVHLAETGVLDNFDPTDCFAQVVGKEAGEYSLPSELADLMVGLARIEPHTSVYTPWDNSIQLAVRAIRIGADAYMETMREPQLPALISLFAEGEIKIVHGDPIRSPSAVEGGNLRKFDTSLTFPPIGTRYTPEVFECDWYGRFREKTTSGSVVAVLHVLAQTRRRAVIAVPNSLLFSPGADRSLREELLSRELIEVVVAMPSGLLPHTNISFALLVLNMNEPQRTIRFVNAEDDRFREPLSKARSKLIDIDGIVARAIGTIEDDLVAEVPTETVLKNDVMLQINRYVLPKSARRTEQLLATSQTRQLGDLISIFRPMPTTSTDDSVRAWEVGAVDLPEFAYIASPDKEVGIDPAIIQKNKSQFLQPLDIVIIIKGSVGKVGIVPKDVPPPGEGGWVVGQSAIILRVDNAELIDPKVLAVYLRSPLGRELLDGIAVKGSTIPLIQQRELQKLQVIIPTKKEGAEIGNILDEQATIQQEIENLRAQQSMLAKRVWALD